MSLAALKNAPALFAPFGSFRLSFPLVSLGVLDRECRPPTTMPSATHDLASGVLPTVERLRRPDGLNLHRNLLRRRRFPLAFLLLPPRSLMLDNAGDRGIVAGHCSLHSRLCPLLFFPLVATLPSRCSSRNFAAVAFFFWVAAWILAPASSTVARTLLCSRSDGVAATGWSERARRGGVSNPDKATGEAFAIDA